MDEKFEDNKKLNPEEKANCISNLFFTWTLPIFRQGHKRDLIANDLFKPLPKHNANRLGDNFEKCWNDISKQDKPLLIKALWKSFWKEMSIYLLVYFLCCFVGKMAQPLLLMRILDYYVPNQTEISQTDAYLSAVAMIVITFIETVGGHKYIMGMQQLGCQMRISINSLLYRKTLRLSKMSLNETSTGQIVTLMSNDLRMFDYLLMEICLLIIAPLELLAVILFLYYFLGLTSLAGIVFMFLVLPLQMFSSKKASGFNLRKAKRTDERISLMNEIILGIKVIKMYAWEKPFSTLVNLARRLEIKQLRGLSYPHALGCSYALFMDRTAIFICIATFVLTGNTPEAKYVFVIISFYNILTNTISMSVPEAIFTYSEAQVSFKRLETFLLLDEIKPNVLKPVKSQDKCGLVLDKVNAKWDLDKDSILKNISIIAQPNDTIAIVGPVGSGKSSLLQVILGELPLTSGDLKISGTVSYACQEPWLFEGSIRQNILFGNTFDANKYQGVINACALQRDFSLFPHADLSIVGEKGVMLSGGQKARINLARAIYKDADIYLLDDPLSAVDAQVGKQLFDQCINGYLAQKCVVLVTHQLQYLRNVNCIYVLKDGEVTASGSYDEITRNGFELAKNLNFNSNDVEVKPKNHDEVNSPELEETDAPDDFKEEMLKGSVSNKVFTTYITSGGSFVLCGTILMLFIVTQASASFSDYFLTFWVNWEQIKTETNITLTETDYFSNFTWISPYFTSLNCIYFYTALLIFITCVTLIRTITFTQYGCTIAENMHNKMFSALIKAPSRFFDINPSGRILNRFSKDIGVIDEQLPYNVFETIDIAIFLLGIATIFAVINPYILIPTFVLGALSVGYKNYFLKTTRSIKRIEGINRSPVFSHMTASLQGLSTIRALKTEQILIREFDQHQDNHTSAYYLFLGCNRAFATLLDLHCIAYMAIVTFTTIATTNMGGTVGLAITQALEILQGLQWGLRRWSDVHNQMTSVERILEYTKLEPEEDCKADPPTAWPEYGKVEFKSVFLRYSESDPYILRNISFNIPPRSKIGIVGRTGAGKSSLITALFKLAPFEGEILIDGINITKVASQSVRTNLSIIPQDPFLFKGTLRKNLDPFDQYDDKVLWEALDEVELKQLVSDSSLGLNYQVSEGGSNFSVGQRQLVCLARAITRSNKILVLDEATANVDHATDELIQRTIQRKLKDCTVLTIAHRLNTIMDSDKVLVIDAGRVVEYDPPHLLLQNPEGVFHSLVMQTGRGMADNLKDVAKLNYKNRIKQI